MISVLFHRFRKIAVRKIIAVSAKMYIPTLTTNVGYFYHC